MENDYKWRKKETPEKWIPILTEEMKSMDNSRLGVVLPKKDREGRPVILIQANRMNKNWDWEIKVQCTYKMVESLDLSFLLFSPLFFLSDHLFFQCFVHKFQKMGISAFYGIWMFFFYSFLSTLSNPFPFFLPFFKKIESWMGQC